MGSLGPLLYLVRTGRLGLGFHGGLREPCRGRFGLPSLSLSPLAPPIVAIAIVAIRIPIRVPNAIVEIVVASLAFLAGIRVGIVGVIGVEIILLPAKISAATRRTITIEIGVVPFAIPSLLPTFGSLWVSFGLPM